MTTNEVRTLSDDKLDALVAQLCNWKPETVLRCAKCDTMYENPENKEYASGVFCPVCKEAGWQIVGVCHVEPAPGKERPKYCEDLNAIHEAEKTMPSSQTGSWMHHLCIACRDAKQHTSRAAARQRVEAFVMTMEKD